MKAFGRQQQSVSIEVREELRSNVRGVKQLKQHEQPGHSNDVSENIEHTENIVRNERESIDMSPKEPHRHGTTEVEINFIESKEQEKLGFNEVPVVEVNEVTGAEVIEVTELEVNEVNEVEVNEVIEMKVTEEKVNEVNEVDGGH